MLEKMKEKVIDFQKNKGEKLGLDVEKAIHHGNVLKGIKDDLTNKRFDNLKTNLLGRFFNHKTAAEEALEVLDNVSGRRDTINDPSVPEDVVDKLGSWIVTKDGFSVLGRILPKQIHSGTQTPSIPFFTIFLSLAVVFYKLNLQLLSLIFGGIFIYTWLLPNGLPSFRFKGFPWIILLIGLIAAGVAIGGFTGHSLFNGI